MTRRVLPSDETQITCCKAASLKRLIILEDKGLAAELVLVQHAINIKSLQMDRNGVGGTSLLNGFAAGTAYSYSSVSCLE